MDVRALLFAAAALAAAGAWAERQPFERYQSIVDRQMFGQPPPGFDPTKSPAEVQKTATAGGRELTEEQQKLQSAVHFSVINVNPSGETEVGFTDNTDPKQPVHYYLKVGASQNGWEVRAADPATATMTIAKGEIELEMKLGDKSADGKAAPAAAVRNGGGGLPMGRTLRERKLQRKQREAAQREAAEQRKAEERAAAQAEREAAQAEREAQRQAELEEQRNQLQSLAAEISRQRAEQARKAAESEKGEETPE